MIRENTDVWFDRGGRRRLVYALPVVGQNGKIEMPQALPAARLASLLALALLSSSPALAQSGALKSGLRGRVVIAPELASAKTWPVGEEEQRRLARGARLRRAMGHGALGQNSEPMPALLVVLEGARSPQKPAARELRVEGMRFVPAQLLVARPGEVRITNAQKGAVTITRAGGDVIGTIQPGESGDFVLEVGDHALQIQEMPFAHATVKVLPPSRFLPVTKGGDIEPIPIESGDYQLAFYHGAHALRVQSLSVPEGKYLAIDAAVSANGVVTVSIKDGDLQVAVPPDPIIPPPPPPPPPRAPPRAPPRTAPTTPDEATGTTPPKPAAPKPAAAKPAAPKPAPAKEAPAKAAPAKDAATPNATAKPAAPQPASPKPAAAETPQEDSQP